MKPITLKKALMLYIDVVCENNIAPLLYLKDGDNHYHNVSYIDIADDKIYCDDDYWDYYDYIMEVEGGANHKLFVEQLIK